MQDSEFDPKGEFREKDFAEYMARVEENFSCSGWCKINYMNKITGQEMYISKYLFTDINRGPPQERGCQHVFITWLTPYIITWGAITLVMVGFEIVLFTLMLTLKHAYRQERGQKPEEIYVVEDRNVANVGRVVENRNYVVSEPGREIPLQVM